MLGFKEYLKEQKDKKCESDSSKDEMDDAITEKKDKKVIKKY